MIRRQPEFIKHNGVKHVICRVRRFQYVAKPEEIFRQRLLNHLIDDLGYPKENIRVEEAMSHFKKRARGRADIIIFDAPCKSKNSNPLIVIECKDPENQYLDIRQHDIIKQVERYAKVLKPTFQIVTNEHQVYGKNVKTGKEFNYIPSLKSLIKDKIKYQKPKPYKWERLSNKKWSSNRLNSQLVKNNYLYPDTDIKFIQHISRFLDLFLDTHSSFEKTTLSDKPYEELLKAILNMDRDHRTPLETDKSIMQRTGIQQYHYKKWLRQIYDDLMELLDSEGNPQFEIKQVEHHIHWASDEYYFYLVTTLPETPRIGSRFDTDIFHSISGTYIYHVKDVAYRLEDEKLVISVELTKRFYNSYAKFADEKEEIEAWNRGYGYWREWRERKREEESQRKIERT